MTYEEIKEKYPFIRRVYVRAEFPVIGEDYQKYLLGRYEDTYYPTSVRNAGRASYVKRNTELIERSQFCVFYFDEAHSPTGRKSGTKIAYDYAIKRKKTIHRFPHFSTTAQAAIKG